MTGSTAGRNWASAERRKRKLAEPFDEDRFSRHAGYRDRSCHFLKVAIAAAVEETSNLLLCHTRATACPTRGRRPGIKRPRAPLNQDPYHVITIAGDSV